MYMYRLGYESHFPKTNNKTSHFAIGFQNGLHITKEAKRKYFHFHRTTLEPDSFIV